ncbi:hypothetical protein [Nocardia farcinica]|uniref:hypothetical protein n=1 Tax=Nocardia farcinica TaxID=37329 RepID=UPI001895B628|nr:hypothetical protein [Nocardia farcinica]MBF6233890.1 hypothetical protein [Nocardia farcinica]
MSVVFRVDTDIAASVRAEPSTAAPPLAVSGSFVGSSSSAGSLAAPGSSARADRAASSVAESPATAVVLPPPAMSCFVGEAVSSEIDEGANCGIAGGGIARVAAGYLVVDRKSSRAGVHRFLAPNSAVAGCEVVEFVDATAETFAARTRGE